MQTVDVKQLKALIEEYQQAGIPTQDLEAQLQQMEEGLLQMANVALEVQEEDLGDGRKQVRFSFAPEQQPLNDEYYSFREPPEK